MAGKLINNILLFGRILRELGLDINPGKMIGLLQALDHVPLNNREDFYYTFRCTLVQQFEDLEIFDQAFDIFWNINQNSSDLGELLNMVKKREELIMVPPPLEENEPPPTEDEENDEPPIIERTFTFSATERLGRKDFAEMTPDEIEEVKTLMQDIVWKLGNRRTRRKQSGNKPPYDLRRTIRMNMRFGGEVLIWARQKPKYKPRPLVVLADISGSMERYTRLLLQFIYSLVKRLDQRVEVFTFGTRLTRITQQLVKSDVDEILDSVSSTVPDWSGGTRIGESIKSFNFEWGRRVLGGGAVVLFISDGWDTGEPELLGEEMARLQRTSHKLIWLNPLIGAPEYEPLTRGTQAAIGFVDEFLPVHNLNSLKALAEQLSTLGENKTRTGQLKKRRTNERYSL